MNYNSYKTYAVSKQISDGGKSIVINQAVRSKTFSVAVITIMSRRFSVSLHAEGALAERNRSKTK